MMKEEKRWLNQGRNDLEAAKWNAEELDKNYIPSRYPNGLPDSFPSEVYQKQDALISINNSEKVLDIVSKLIKV